MNILVVYALLTRYVLLYTRSPVRLVELFFWPFVQLLVWGFLTQYLQSEGTGKFPQVISFLIGGIILWDALFRAQQGVAISFLEDVWTRNLLNIFAAPVRMTEYLAATFAVGFLRVLVTGLMMAFIAYFAYQFNILRFNLSLFYFYGNLMLFGWALGILVTALILRFGHGAEALAWAIPFTVQPVAAVFYPVSALPHWLQPVALSLPPAHIFEGMRYTLLTGNISWSHIGISFGLNIFYLCLCGIIFATTLRSAKRRGSLVKVSTG